MNPVTFRAILYAIPLFLGPFADKLVPLMWDGKWPTPQSFVASAVLGTVAVAIGLRAYYDGSAERARTTADMKNPTDGGGQ
jgi:hypothetical protein